MRKLHGMEIVLTPPQLRLLLVICRMWSAGEHITLRALMREMGYRSPNAVAVPIEILRAKGFVDYEDGKKATIRPRCQIRIFRHEPEPE